MLLKVVCYLYVKNVICYYEIVASQKLLSLCNE